MAIPGTNIRALRGQLGLSLKALAAATEMDPGNLSKLERGESGYSQDAISRIAKALHVSVGVLFSEADVVEAAAVRMRQVPVITPEELLHWKGGRVGPEDDNRRVLHANLNSISRHGFALLVANGENAPWLDAGDEVLFDAARQPKIGDIVVAQDRSGQVIIGRFRPLLADQQATGFEVLSLGIRQHVLSVGKQPWQLRGTMTECRRYF